MFLAQLRNELWKLFGKKRTYIGFAAFAIVQLLMLLLFRLKGQSDMERRLAETGYLASEYISALTVSFFILLPQTVLLMPLYITLVGGDLVAKEAEDGTLRMILSRPISRWRLLLVKWTTGMVFTAVLVLMLAIVAIGVASILFPWKGMLVMLPRAFNVLSPGEGLARLAFSQLFLIVNASSVLSIAFMFSSFNMKPAAATILALSYMLVSFVMENLPFFEDYQNWFLTHHFGCWRLVLLNPIPWPQILQSEIVLVAMSATAFIIGAIAFQVRDFKS